MQNASPDLGRWSSIVEHIGSIVELDASARTHGALIRRRGVKRAADLLKLALLYGPGQLSLRSTASFAAEGDIAQLCDVSLLERLRNAADWLGHILEALLSRTRGVERGQGRFRLALVDGSTVSVPGSTGSDWRLHARYEPAGGGFTDLRITEATTAEALSCVTVCPGDVVVCDRGYARVRNFRHVRAHGGHFITRIGWNCLKLYHPSGQPLELFTLLPATGADVVEHAVRIGSARTAIAARLVIAPIPAEALERQHQRIRRKASKRGVKTDPRTLQAAGYLMVVTSLSAEHASATEIVRLYRLRWQIEFAFKRLKSLGGFDELRAGDPRLVRSWLLAHLIATALIESALGEVLDSPPCGGDVEAEAHIAVEDLANRPLPPVGSDFRAAAPPGARQPTRHPQATT
jgi:hypothetical protein